MIKYSKNTFVFCHFTKTYTLVSCSETYMFMFVYMLHIYIYMGELLLMLIS